jgi:hypothetical protein
MKCFVLKSWEEGSIQHPPATSRIFVCELAGKHYLGTIAAGGRFSRQVVKREGQWVALLKIETFKNLILAKENLPTLTHAARTVVALAFSSAWPERPSPAPAPTLDPNSP